MKEVGKQVIQWVAGSVLGLILCSNHCVYAQSASNELRWKLGEDGAKYLKATVAAQVWLRYNESNPGTTVNGFAKDQTYDIGIRRARFQVFGQLHEKVFVYTQMGINNFGYNSTRKPGVFFHDVVTQFDITPRAVQLGAGLTAWNGFARYSSASITSSVAVDLPLYQQTTAEVNDQFLRKLSVYAKGKLGKLDYRFVASNPMIVDASVDATKPIHQYSEFSYAPPKIQTAAYLMYQFLDEESNLIPYNVGTYLGTKRVFNIGAGFQYQPDAMWHYRNTTNQDTIYEDLLLTAVDVFFDSPLGNNGSAITAYAALSHTDYGKEYLRNLGPMNPGSGGTSLNGAGTALPLFGTGNTVYTQAGYLLPQNFLAKAGKIQPYGELMVGKFDRLNDPMVMWSLGTNWMIDSQRAKITVGYQNRPVFDANGDQSDRKSMVVLQFQVAI